MPGEVDAVQSGEAERSRYDKETPDLVGEELGDNARIWREYDCVSKEEDRERVANWNRGLDNLALFAGLFSAVTTAFIIESQNDTKPDYARLTFLVLNASATGVPFREEPFVIDSSVRTVNCLWIASLILSLTAALIAIMGKDWIGMYSTRPACNPRQWAEIRTYRLGCVERWYMSGVIASAPVLLHMSLVLFAAGLVVFVAPDPFSQRLALGLSVAVGALYSFTVLSAVLFPASPFKSPATQAFRKPLLALFAYLHQTLSHGPKRRPITVLQLATLNIGTFFSHPLAPDLIPTYRFQRRGLWRRGFALWDRIFPCDRASPERSWRNTIVGMSSRINLGTVALVHALRALPSAIRQEYLFRRQRPRSRPLRSALHLYLRQIDLSDRWTAIRVQPTPETLALAISRLNEMSHSPDTSHCILMALGDLPLGPSVAPLVSLAIRTRLRAEIRDNWRKADHTTLSRYILADQNISSPEELYPVLHLIDVVSRFERVTVEPSLQSENSLFAISKLCDGILWEDVVAPHCPDVTTQPRGLQYLLALYQEDEDRYYDWEGVIILASRYWHHLVDDQSVDLEHELQRRTSPEDEESYKMDLLKFGCKSGLVERLVFLIPRATAEVAKAAWAIITNILAAEFGHCQHRCLVYAFDDDGPLSVDTALEVTGRSSRHALQFLASSLPLHQYRCFVRDVFKKPSDDSRAFAVSLAGIISRLLSPSSPQDWTRWKHVALYLDTTQRLSHVELCVRCLQAQLCHPRSVLDDDSKLQVIRLMLETVALIFADRFWELRYYPNPGPTTERSTINILTAIARQLARVMARVDTFDTGARLFSLFSRAEAKDFDGMTVTWDLARYLNQAQDRLKEQDPSTAVSMSRLHSALGALRPFCETRDDLRAAWNRLGLPPDAYDNLPLGDLDLDEFIDPDYPTAREPLSRKELPAHAADNLDRDVSAARISLFYLEASIQ